MRIGVAILIVFLCGENSRAEESPSAYAQALAAFEAQPKTAITRSYFGGMSGLIGDLYHQAQRECVIEGLGGVHLIVRIEAGGKVAEVAGDPEGPVVECYRRILLQTPLTSPPFAPFYGGFRMEDPKPLQDEKSAPTAEGSVVLAILVGKDGRVKDGKIIESSGHAELDEKMLEHAIRTWRLEPRMEKGKAVEGWGQFRVTIRLEDEVSPSAEAP